MSAFVTFPAAIHHLIKESARTTVEISTLMKRSNCNNTDRHIINCTKQKPNPRRIFYDPIICINLIGTENRAIMKTRSLKGGLEIEADQVTHKQQRVVITPDLAYLGYRRQSMTPRKASVSRAAAAKVAAGRSIKG